MPIKVLLVDDHKIVRQGVQAYLHTLADIQVIAEGPDQTVVALVVSPKVGSFSTVNTEPAKPALLLLRAARCAFSICSTRRVAINCDGSDPTPTPS